MDRCMTSATLRTMVAITLVTVSAACQRTGQTKQDDAGEAQAAPTAEGATTSLPNSTATATTPPATQSELAGTSWRLVRIQSMDDKTYAPEDRSRYTISFGADGRATMRIDCNRGSATWMSAQKGELAFGPTAMTKMMCPPGSLYDRVVKDLEFVRSYVLKDGHLFISLMADGAIYEFEPAGAVSEGK